MKATPETIKVKNTPIHSPILKEILLKIKAFFIQFGKDKKWYLEICLGLIKSF